YRIHHRIEHVVSSHQANKPLRVVEHAKAPMPAVTLTKRPAPVSRVEIGIKYTAFVTPRHEPTLGKVDVLVIHRALGIYTDFTFRLTQCLAKRIDGPVVVGVFQGTCRTVPDVYIGWHVTELVVVFVTHTAGCRTFEVIIGSMLQGFPKELNVIATQAFDVRIRNH